MTSEPVRVVFHLDRDPRLVDVLCGIVEFQAANAGLESDAGGSLARAAGDVCRATIADLLQDEEGYDVTVDTFPDRIEIAIHSRGQLAPAVGLEMFAAAQAHADKPSGVNGMELLSRVDRVLFNTEDGVARTTLVKFLPSRR